MEKVYYIFLLLLSSSLIAQNADDYNNWHVNYIFSIDVNTFIPTGHLKNTLDENIGLGFYFGLPVSKSMRIDLGTSLFFPKTNKKIVFFNNDEVLEGGAITSGALGVWVTHVKPIGKSWSWEKRLGLGVGFFQTDIETGKPREENDRVYGAETISFSIGTGVRARVFKRNIGVKLDYFYVPYNLFKKKFPSNFGDQYLTLGLTFGI